MKTLRKQSGPIFLVALSAVAVLLILSAPSIAAKMNGQGWSAETKGKGAAESHPREKQPGRWSRDIIRRGNLIIISKQLADQVRKNNDIILSTVAIKTRLDKDGRLDGFQLFQVDSGSIVEKMGFMPKDVLTGVNGIPARDLQANRQSLDSADRFDITIMRNGKEKRLGVEIR